MLLFLTSLFCAALHFLARYFRQYELRVFHTVVSGPKIGILKVS
jgi:hypothetical protein